MRESERERERRQTDKGTDTQAGRDNEKDGQRDREKKEKRKALTTALGILHFVQAVSSTTSAARLRAWIAALSGSYPHAPTRTLWNVTVAVGPATPLSVPPV